MQEHILIVDDRDDLLLILRRALEHQGYRVSQASGGEEALQTLAAEVPDLIVSDIAMPDLDGFELVQRVRGDHRLAGVPVIFLTAAASHETEARARACGVEGFMAKPCTSRRLLALVRGTLDARPETSSRAAGGRREWHPG